jgi:molybdate transport system substrate-binding protein
MISRAVQTLLCSCLGRTRAGLAAAVVGVGTFLAAPTAQAQDVLVFAAASLKNALDEVGTVYAAASGKKVAVAYAASSALAKQIENKAPADIFISADLDWMDYVARQKLIRPETRTNLLGNRLVLIAPVSVPAEIEIRKDFPLATLLGDGRLAVGDPAHVPAGKYAKAALEALNVWNSVEPKLAPTDNVRAALALVSRRETLYGIVYETDTKSDKSVKVAGVFPADSYPPVIYPAAILTDSTTPDTQAFFDYLKSPAASTVFQKHGFSQPAPTH